MHQSVSESLRLALVAFVAGMFLPVVFFDLQDFAGIPLPAASCVRQAVFGNWILVPAACVVGIYLVVFFDPQDFVGIHHSNVFESWTLVPAACGAFSYP